MAYDPVKAKAYRKKNAEKIKAYAKAYNQRPEVRARNNANDKKRRDASPYNYVRQKLWQQKSAAKRRGLVWELDIDATIAKILRQGHCKLSGVKFVYKGGKDGKRNLYCPSIDRIDSSKGYVPGNVMFVCWGVNYMKQDLPQDLFIELCTLVEKKAGRI